MKKLGKVGPQHQRQYSQLRGPVVIAKKSRVRYFHNFKTFTNDYFSCKK